MYGLEVPADGSVMAYPTVGMRMWTKEQTSSWITKLNLSDDYGSTFFREEIDGEALCAMNINELRHMGIRTVGDRLRIMNSIEGFNVEDETPSSPTINSSRKTSECSSVLLYRGSSVRRQQSRKQGGCTFLSEQDPIRHHMWGTLHKKGVIPGTQQQWAQYYRQLEAIRNDNNLWMGFFVNDESKDGDGCVNGLFQWGDFQVAAEPVVIDIVIDNHYDMTPARLVQLFNRFDRDGDGQMGLSELGSALRHQGFNSLERRLRDIFKTVDLNNDYKIYIPEFEACMTSLKMAHLISFRTEGKNEAFKNISILDYCPEEATVDTLNNAAEFFFGHRNSNYNRWIHISRVSQVVLLLFAVKYHLHPLGIEAALGIYDGIDSSTKVEKYGDHFFISLTYFFLTQTEPRVAYQSSRVVFFVSGNPKWDTIISVVQGPQPASEKLGVAKDYEQSIWEFINTRIVKSQTRSREYKVDFLLYELLETCLLELRPITQAYRSRLTYFHELLSEQQVAFPRCHLNELSGVIMELSELHRNVRPMRHLLRQLLEEKSLGDDCKMYLQDTGETMDQALDDIHQLRDMCKSLNEDYNRYNDRMLNDTLGILTVASTLFMPAQFVSSIYGMNFDSMPELHWEFGYIYFWVLTLLYFALVGYIAFRRLTAMRLKGKEPGMNIPDLESGKNTAKRRSVVLLCAGTSAASDSVPSRDNDNVSFSSSIDD